MKKKKRVEPAAGLERVEEEIRQNGKKKRRGRAVRVLILTLMTLTAAAITASVIWTPMVWISGRAMASTINDGEIIVAQRWSPFERGDVIVFWFNNKMLVKRVIAYPGEEVSITPEGYVSVDGKPIDEPYVTERTIGDCNIKLPYEVPENRYFVMGDCRTISQDSRNAAIGCVPEDQIIGRVIYRLWPRSSFGNIDEEINNVDYGLDEES